MRNRIFLSIFLLILLAGFYVRSAGLFRGLENGYVFHPDAPKQVNAINHYIKGEYVWYVDSWFYDGYPLFLNHIDEWAIRTLHPLVQVLHDLFLPDTPLLQNWHEGSLYYLARSLRVFYGMMALLLLYPVARRTGLGHENSLFALLLVALAPVSAAVTHSATGDVGVDLFAVSVLAILALHQKQRSLWLFFAAGVLSAFAFAAKYHGAMACIPVAVYGIAMTAQGEMKIRSLFKAGVLSFAGFLAGTALAIPQLLWATERTWSDMTTNFRRISAYKIPDQIADQPLWIKAQYSFMNNVPMLAGNTGILFSLLTVAGALFVIIRAYRKKPGKNPRSKPQLALITAIVAFFILSVVLSLVFKVAVQPFHFSFLVPLMAVLTVSLLAQLWDCGSITARVATAFIALALVFESTSAITSETFFWKRDDTKPIADNFFSETFKHNAYSEDLETTRKGFKKETIRNFTVEYENPAVFRNPERLVRIKSGRFWNELSVPPAPCVSFQDSSHWISASGPAFPRNDRMIAVDNSHNYSRHVIFRSRPAELVIGIRSTDIPLLCNINGGGIRKTAELEPDSAAVLRFPWPKYRKQTDRGNGNAVYLVPFSISVKAGRASVRVLPSRSEIQHFRIFSGDPKRGDRLDYADWVRHDLPAHIAQTRFLDSELKTLPTFSPEETYRLFPDDAFLPCGRYRLVVNCIPVRETTRVNVELFDKRGLSRLIAEEKDIVLAPGKESFEYVFTKPFAPHLCNLRVRCLSGQIMIKSWEIRPQAERMAAELRTFAESDVRPAWLHRYPTQTSGFDKKGCEPHRFENGITVLKVHAPREAGSNGAFRVAVLAEVNRPGKVNWKEDLLVFRLKSIKTRKSHSINIPVWKLSYSPEMKILIPKEMPEDIKPGRYTILMGMVNARTRLKYRLPRPSFFKKGKSWIEVGEIEITGKDL